MKINQENRYFKIYIKMKLLFEIPKRNIQLLQTT